MLQSLDCKNIFGSEPRREGKKGKEKKGKEREKVRVQEKGKKESETDS